MIAKKNSRYDLERKRIVLFQIGLLTAGSFTLAAFTYTSEVKINREKEAVAYEPVTWVVDDMKEKPKKEVVIVKTPQVQQEKQTATNQSATPSEDMAVAKNKSTEVKSSIGTKILGPPSIGTGDSIIYVPTEEIDSFPAIEAQYIGGYNAMMGHIESVMVYPQIDIEYNNQGKVFVSFVVERDGSVSNVKIERGVTETIDHEAKRIVRSFPKWKPAENAYGKVRARVLLPLNFVLTGN